MLNQLREFEQALNSLQEYNTPENVKSCKESLNNLIKLYKDAVCLNFIYTINTDKLPFGCIVTPVFIPSENTVNSIFIDGSDDYVINNYEVELDSKLFDYKLDAHQVAQIILYNVFHLSYNSDPVKRFREILDIYLTNHDKILSIRDSIQYQSILELGLVDTLVQLTNCMYLEDTIINDPFLEELGYDDFNVTLDTMFKQIPGCENSEVRKPRLSMLDWCLRLYDDVEKERIPALRLMEKCKEITASSLYIKRFNAIINSLNRIDTDSVITESVNQYITESKKKNSLFSQIKYNGLRGIEEDLYEFIVRARNADTEEEVMYALKQINVRISILDEYLRNEEMSDQDRERWTNVLNKYRAIRDDIANKKVYNKRNYGIFIDYNKLDQLDDNNNDNDYY